MTARVARPLAGVRVLVTRPTASAGGFVGRLHDAGAETILAPTIVIGPPDDPERAARAVAEIHSYAWVAFTSRNGVAAFFSHLHSGAGDALAGVGVAAVGPATAGALAERGIRADFVPVRHIGDDIARGLVERTAEGDRILLYRAQEARDIVPQTLRAEGRIADDVAAYRTSIVRDPAIAAAAARAHVWTFTSGSTVAGLLANLDAEAARAAGKCIACIGPIAAAAARHAGWNVDVVAETFTAERLVDALVRRTLHATV